MGPPRARLRQGGAGETPPIPAGVAGGPGERRGERGDRDDVIPFPGEGGACPREEVGATPRLPPERARRGMRTVPASHGASFSRCRARAAPGPCQRWGASAPCRSRGSWDRHWGKAPHRGQESPVAPAVCPNPGRGSRVAPAAGRRAERELGTGTAAHGRTGERAALPREPRPAGAAGRGHGSSTALLRAEAGRGVGGCAGAFRAHRAVPCGE